MLQADTLFSGAVVRDTVITATAEPPADSLGMDFGMATGQALATVQGFIDGFFAALPRVAVGLLALALFWGIARGIRGVVHRVTPGSASAPIGIVLGRIAYALMLTLGLLIALVVVFPTFTVASLVGALGIGGIAIGFAFKDIFQNLLAGILLLLRQPFRVGDEIISEPYTGTVEAIETRATFIRTYDGKRIIVPNADIYAKPVSVITAYDMVRSEYDVGIGYGDDIEAAKRIALDVLGGVEAVLADPAPDVRVWELAASSVHLRLRWWTRPDRPTVVRTRDAVLQRVAEAMAAGGIDLPFPTQVVLFHDQTEETDGDRTRQREGWPPPTDGAAPRSRRAADAEA